MQLHRLKSGPAEPHAMIEVCILLSAIIQMGRNVASIFCHEIIKNFSAEPLAATRGTLGYRGTQLENTGLHSETFDTSL